MKKILKYSVMAQFLALTVLLFGGCRSYDDPAPAKRYNDLEILSQYPEGLISIKDLKQIYYNKVPNPIEDNKLIVKGIPLEIDRVVKGKVIGDDGEGNIYRTMYIQDETGAIEIKYGVTNSQNTYKPGQIVYVRLKGLVIGSYRYNLSVGGAAKEGSEYANGYIDISRVYVKRLGKTVNVIEKGYMAGFSSSDTLVVRSAGQLTDDNIGQLIRIEGAESIWGQFGTDPYPSFFYSVNKDYETFAFEKVIKDWQDYYTGATTVRPTSPRISKGLIKPPYAFKNPETNVNFFGSSLFRLGGSIADNANFVVRVSGYSKFANEPVPAHGKKVNITAMYIRFSGPKGDYKKAQLLLNTHKDVVELP